VPETLARPIDRSATVTAQPPARGILAALPYLLDIVVPLVSFYALTAAGLSTFWALVVGGSLTAAVSLVNTIRRGRLDSLGVLVIVEIVLGLTLDLTVQDARLTLARSSLFIAVGGFWLLASVYTRRPITLTTTKPFAAKRGPAGIAAFDWLADHSPRFLRVQRMLTTIWGVAFLAYAMVRVIVIYAVNITEAVWLNEVPGIIAIVICMIASARAGKIFQAMVDERIATGT
jgi:hypothetical protein